MRFHTDLACERRSSEGTEEGVSYTEWEERGFTVSRLTVTSPEGARAIGKPEGVYVTLGHPPLWELSESACDAAARTLAALLAPLCEQALPCSVKKARALVVGLGNRSITADAIGPATVERLIATQHLATYEPVAFARMDCAAIATVAPGVLAETGMESARMIAGIVSQLQPHLILAIDALAARSCSRLATTVQICDTGITPGDGIGNTRQTLNAATLGVPVIAIGIPTVVDAATLVLDAAERAGIPAADWGDALQEEARYFVSPKEIDRVTDCGADLLACALHRLFGVLK